MKNNPQCENCGGSEYILESGFYFCAECNFQSQEIIEQVYDFYSGQSVAVTKKVSTPTAKDDHSQIETSATRKVLTSWEVLNYILVGLVKELILLGANPDLKKITLKLWAAYLMKIEVAFISQSLQKKPRLGVLFRRKDAEVVYGAADEVSRAHRRPVYRPRKRARQKSVVSDTSRTSLSSRSEKYRLSLKKKALAKSEYLETSSLASQSSLLTMETLTDLSLSQTSSKRSHKLRYTRHAKLSFVSLLESAKNLEELDRRDIQTKLMTREGLSVRHITLMQVVAILRLALILAREDIHLADIFRWNEEGYISISNAEKLLPPDVSVEKDVKAVFGNFPNSRTHVEMNVGRISNLIGLNGFKMNVRSTIKRYCFELQLPAQVMNIIDKLIQIKSAELNITTCANYEGRAMAMVIFVLKLLFALDGVTERKLSELAAKLNNEANTFTFNWMQWVKFINARGAVCANYHSPIREKLYPNSRFGGPDPFLSQWDNTPVRQVIQRDHVIDHTVKDTLRRALRGLMSDTVEPFPPSKTPLTLILNTILERKDNNIPPLLKKLLQTKFEEHSLDFLLSSDMLDNLQDKFNCTVKPVLGCECIREKARTFPRTTEKPKKSLKTKKVKLYLVDKSKLSDSTDQELTYSYSTGSDISHCSSQKIIKNDNVYYFPGEYWLYKGKYSIRDANVSQFEDLASELFPESFFWLLKECARMIGQPIRDLYFELMKVEKLYINFKS